MKKYIIPMALLSTIIVFFAIVSCRPHEAPTEPDPCNPGPCTPTLTPTPVPGVLVAVTGNVYMTFLSTNPASGLTVTAYKVDGTCARTGSSFAATTTNAAGAFSLNLETSNNYELEITNGTSYIHAFLPPVTGAKSGIKIIFGDLSTMGMMINGGLLIVMSSSGNIQSADTITLDGGANINNATSSNGTYAGVQLMDTPFTISLGTIDVLVGDSSSSGISHTVAYKGVQRKVMVYYLDSYHGSEAIFY